MKLDLSSLEHALASLDESLTAVDNQPWFDAQPSVVQNTLIAGVIQNFEFVYELSIKMMRRRIETDAATPSEADFANFRDLLRTAVEKGLIADPTAWFEYRAMRNITAHTEDHQKALSVYAGTHRFIGDAQALFQELTARNA
ncbi:MAG: nucleotidyltransferase substrate binding protein [Chloroflexota bacterium]